MANIFIALGSNKGNRHFNLQTTTTKLQSHVNVCFKSPIYSTVPIGMGGKRVFNQILFCQTTLSPKQLLNKTQEIERSLGRGPDEKGKSLPRTIDIDILTYGGRRVRLPTIILPHPRMFLWFFVLIPLNNLLITLERKKPSLFSQINKSFVKKVFTARKALHVPKNAIRTIA
ncbi:2-amino-4-hydroxy-6-hydroxymethyldihydropteridine diphosphokinase [Candidatus Micrarchaeota archaeon CG08_land_8_20_14_0_20_49_17]|nr:MAG: 2-amino-4-hydroxy-6-hydroxymethyldihydropteridine diphosphokinase [Candidatus Micrarchaeota archaeon CG08_land_8_20_14_0_20_49_17]